MAQPTQTHPGIPAEARTAARVRAALVAVIVGAGAGGAGAGGIALPDVSLSGSAPLADKPTPELGEIREFTGPVGTVDCRRWEITDTNAGGYLVSRCGDYLSYLSAEHDYNIVKITDKDGNPRILFEPFYPGISFPLEVGRRWQGAYTGYTASDGMRWDGHVTCEVQDYEELTVAAGTFQTYRIECRDEWTAGTMASSGNTTSWYAPEVKGIVKTIGHEDSRWNSELKAIE